MDTTFNLRTNHYGWIVDAAMRQYESKIEELEMRILRHSTFKDDPFPHPLGATRATVVDDARRFLEQYREVLRFLIEAKRRITEDSAEEAAREMREWLRLDRRRSRARKR